MTGQLYFGVLVRCIMASFAVLLFSHLSNIPSAARNGALIAAIVPLIWYHLAFLARKKAYLSGEAAVDSVYYYGFLLTIGALAFSTLEVAFRKDALTLGPLLAKFGIGLFATAYAVVARLHLQSLAGAVDGGQDDTMSAAARAHALVNELELAAIKVRGFADTVQAEAHMVHGRALADVQEQIGTATKKFEDSIEGAFSFARAGIGELQDALKELSFVDEREQVRAVLSETSKTTRSLNRALATWEESASTTATRLKELAQQLGDVRQVTGDLQQSLQPMVSGPHSLPAVIASSVDAAQSASSTAAAIGTSAVQLRNLIAEAGGGLESMLKLQKVTDETLQIFSQVNGALASVGDALSQMSNVLLASQGVMNQVRDSSGAMPDIAREAAAVHAALNQLQQAISRSAAALAENVDQSSRAGTMLIDSLSRVASTIVDSTRKR
jgi:chaperonin cofactor prefoldin